MPLFCSAFFGHFAIAASIAYLGGSIMNEEQLWEKFFVSGKIDDYLNYSNKKETENDDT